MRRLLPSLLVAAVAIACAPPLDLPLRAEDYLAVDTYSRIGPLDLVTRPHLDMRLFGYWRPLSDGFTWALVRATGGAPWPMHAALLALHVAAALLAGKALRALCGLSAGAGLATSLIAAAHPWSTAVIGYSDGGGAALIAALFTLLALVALGRWRDGEGPLTPLVAAAALAALAYDAALVLPVVLVAVAAALPRAERRVPWAVLLVVPAVLATRWLAVGRAFDGYELPEGFAAAFPGRLLLCAQRLFLPYFDEFAMPRTELALALAAVALAAAVVAVATRRGGLERPLRQGLALALLVAGLLGYAPDLFTQARGAAPDELVLAYKSYPAALAAALAIGWWLGRATGRKGIGCVLLSLPVVALFAWQGRTLAGEHARAARWAGDVVEGVRAHAAGSAAGSRHFLVQEVPVKAERNGRSIARVLQFGLASALRPPLQEPELFAWPLFRRELDGAGAYLSDAAAAAFARLPWLEPLRCRYVVQDGLERVLVEAAPRPPPQPALGVRLFARADAREEVIAGLAQVPESPVAPDGSLVITVRGREPGTPRFVVLNRTHPFSTQALDLVPAAQRPADAAPDVLLVKVASPWLLEHATRFPGDVSFFVLEFLPDGPPVPGAPGATVSNVLALRLVAAPR